MPRISPQSMRQTAIRRDDSSTDAAAALRARPQPLSRPGYPIALALALFLGLLLNLHAVPLFDVDEGAFSEATREMLARGDYVTTWLNGQPRFDKPILIYWLQALSVSLFGINEFAFRLPSALAGIGWVLAVLAFARRHGGRETGFAAALIAATTLGLGIIGRGAIADALLNFFLALSMFDIYRYMENPQPRFRYRTWLWMALGFLTKGPIALLIPFAVSAIAFLLHGKHKLWWRAVLDPAGWLILLAVAGPWYLLEYQRQGQAFIDGFFMRHNVERFRGTLQGHGGGILYYLPALLLLLLPYTGLFLRMLPALREWRRTPLATFLWSWFLFVLAFFSLSGTKLPHYLLYGITPLFILMALHRDSLRSHLLAFGPPVFLLCLALGLPSLLQWASPRIDSGFYREMLARRDMFDAAYYALVALALSGTLALAFASRNAVWQRLVATGLLCSAAVSGIILPAIGELQQGAVKEAAAIAKQSGLPVATWQINLPSFSVYLDAVPKPFIPPGNGELVFTRVDRMLPLDPANIIYRKGGVVLVRTRN
ncbi:glycosyltransferase family 39 protein [Herbaspirillum sp. HC18]|nr:glycosyltransferase family 39 protein [Herbaspirillum sp. HC18]